MKELRVGIAGLGRLGRVHAANLAHKIPGAVLTAACVPGADSQAYARQELGLEKVYGDFREMVAVRYLSRNIKHVAHPNSRIG